MRFDRYLSPADRRILGGVCSTSPGKPHQGVPNGSGGAVATRWSRALQRARHHPRGPPGEVPLGWVGQRDASENEPILALHGPPRAPRPPRHGELLQEVQVEAQSADPHPGRPPPRHEGVFSSPPLQGGGVTPNNPPCGAEGRGRAFGPREGDLKGISAGVPGVATRPPWPPGTPW